MAQTIAQSLEILNDTMTNSKTALQGKGVTVEDTYKLSDVDEKIAEIEAGEGSSTTGFHNITDFSCNIIRKNCSFYEETFDPEGAKPFDLNLKFTVTEDDCWAIPRPQSSLKWDPAPVDRWERVFFEKNTTYTVTGSNLYDFSIMICKKDGYGNISNIDFVGVSNN